MTLSSPSLPAGEDLQHSSRRSAKGLLLRFLVREGVQLSTNELVAIAHALGEVAIADPHGALCGSLDTIGVDASGRVHLHSSVPSSEPAVDAIKRELARLGPVVRDPLGLRRILAVTAQGAEQYLDQLAEFSDAPPREVLGELVGRWMAQYSRAWSMADAPNDTATENLDTSGTVSDALTRFGRQRARHGAEIPGDWASEAQVPWQERRRAGEPLAESRGWTGQSRVLLFVGEEPAPAERWSSEQVAREEADTTLDVNPSLFAMPAGDTGAQVRRPVFASSSPPNRAPAASRVKIDGWHRAGHAIEGVRRTMLRYVRSHSPFGASQPS